MAETDDPRRNLPSVDALLGHPAIAPIAEIISPVFIVRVIREAVDGLRKNLESGKSLPPIDRFAQSIADRLGRLSDTGPRRAINATGVVLHTGLGRAPMSDAARKALQAAAGYCDLEIDLKSGDRGDRQAHVESLLRVLTGADAAIVVNNNAAALFLVLNTLSNRRETIVSRGQLIEIGGSFRLPDIMQRSGARLVEVGTTNRTRVQDYREAITERTALLLRAHPSNYKIEGFTENVGIADLVTLGREHSIIVAEDLGNGLLWDWSEYGLPHEENVHDSLNAGADLVLVSGDKVLGGPQAGIILGRASLIKQLKRSPLARVLRADKLAIAALAATLAGFLDQRRVHERIPVWNLLAQSVSSLQMRAEKIAEMLRPLCEWQELSVQTSTAEAGSGTLPAVQLPSVSLCLLPRGKKAAAWSRSLRMEWIPVIGTVRQDLVWLDMRTVFESDVDDLVHSVSRTLLTRG